MPLELTLADILYTVINLLCFLLWFQVEAGVVVVVDVVVFVGEVEVEVVVFVGEVEVEVVVFVGEVEVEAVVLEEVSEVVVEALEVL